MGTKTENHSGSTVVNSSGDVPEASAKGAFDPARFLRVILQSWKLVLIVAAVSGGVAVAASEALKTPRYRAQGTLKSNKLLIPEDQKTFVPIANFATHVALVCSLSNMEELGRECNIPVNPQDLQKFFKVEEPMGDVQKINIQIDGMSPEEAVKMVNLLMSIHIERTAEKRNEAVEVSLQQIRNKIQENRDDLAKAREALRTILEKNKILDLKAEREQATKDIATQQTDKATAERKLGNLRALIKDHQSFIAEVRRKLENNEPIKLDEDDNYKKLVNDLNDKLITAEGRFTDVKNELKKANDEYAAEEFAVKKGFGKPAELKRLGQVVKAAEDKVASERKLFESAKKQFAEETKDPAMRYVKSRDRDKRKLEEEATGVQGEIADIGLRLETLQERARRMEAVYKEAEEPDREVTRLGEQRKLLELQATALGSVSKDFRELAVESKALSKPIGSNARNIMVITFAVPMMIFLAGLVGAAMLSSTWKAETLAAKLKLPVLARCSGQAQTTAHGRVKVLNAEEARGLALRLRQYVSDTGGIILFTSLNDGAEVDDMIGDLSHYLAMRDERVLILDTRIANAELAGLVKLVERPVEVLAGDGGETGGNDADPCMSGLVQYLVFEGQDLNDYIHPTTTRGVFFMPAGGPYNTTDALASDPMRQLLDRLRKQYSVILMVGPSVAHTTDTEIMAAYVNGIIVLINGSTGSFAAAEPFFQSLKEANAPLVGSVLCL